MELCAAAATLGAAGALVFGLVVVAPGDPIDLLPNGEAVREVLEARWGLDQPVPVRIWRWWTSALSGDLGTSLVVRPGTPVATLISGPLMASGLRIAAAVGLASTVASALALMAPAQGWARSALVLLSVPPVFLLAHLGVFAANETAWALIQNDWIARPGWFALPDQASSVREALAVTCLALGSGTLAALHQELSGVVQRIRNSPLADATVARGEPLWPVLLRHLVPGTLQAIAARIAALTGGVLVVEKLLLMPGAGALLWNSAHDRDAEVVLALGVAAAAGVVGTRLVTSVLHIAIDPRLRRAT